MKLCGMCLMCLFSFVCVCVRVCCCVRFVVVFVCVLLTKNTHIQTMTGKQQQTHKTMRGGGWKGGCLLEFGINGDGDGHACFAGHALLACPLSFPKEGGSCNYAWCSHAARRQGESPHTLCLRMSSHKTWSMCNYAIRPIPGPAAQS